MFLSTIDKTEFPLEDVEIPCTISNFQKLLTDSFIVVKILLINCFGLFISTSLAMSIIVFVVI